MARKIFLIVSLAVVFVALCIYLVETLSSSNDPSKQYLATVIVFRHAEKTSTAPIGNIPCEICEDLGYGQITKVSGTLPSLLIALISFNVLRMDLFNCTIRECFSARNTCNSFRPTESTGRGTWESCPLLVQERRWVCNPLWLVFYHKIGSMHWPLLIMTSIMLEGYKRESRRIFTFKF